MLTMEQRLKNLEIPTLSKSSVKLLSVSIL